LSSPEASSSDGRDGQYSFKGFTLDTEQRILLRGSEEVPLRAKSFDVLIYLVDHHTELVTKAALMETVWSNTAVTDNSLAQCIAEIRRALDDESQTLIRTVARRGYVFAGPVTTPTLQFPSRPLPSSTGSQPLVVTVPSKPGRFRAAWGVAALLAAVIAGVLLLLPARPVKQERSYTQLTNFSDSAVGPVLSADGRMLAFYRSNSFFHTPDQIYVKILPGGEPVPLTNDPRLKYGLAFSPDGSRIAYTAVEPGVGWLTYTMSPLGGEPTLLLSNAAGLSWLNPQRVLFSEIHVHPHMGVVTSTESRSEYRKLYFPQHERAMAHYSYPSPDRKWALVVEMDPVWKPCRLIALEGGPAMREVGPRGPCTSAGWSPDGRWMYFSAEVQGNHQVWRQRFPAGRPEQITSGPAQAEGIAVDPDGRSLITSIGLHESAIWLHDERGERQLSTVGHVSPRHGLSQLTNYLALPSVNYSPDGKSLFCLMSHDSPAAPTELWRMDLASGKVEPLLRGVSMEKYDVSPNGKRVVYSSRPDGHASEIWIAPLDGSSPPKRIASMGENDPYFGPEGQVFFRYTDGKANYIGQISAQGVRGPKLIEDKVDGIYAVSPDHRWLVAGVLAPGYGTVAIPVGGGTPVRICGGYCPTDWAPDGRFFYVGIEPSSNATPGKTLAIPIPPGKALPDLPILHIAGRDSISVPGSQVVEGWQISPGTDPSIFAFMKTTMHRNLFRVPLPPD
jgi:DNA-binding winged helix-turn-helix (wHTH) protein/dipeptidyl aminopeptidase/acylaminoacyl peptidase